MEIRAELTSPARSPEPVPVETALARYAEAYQRLYQRTPRDLRAIDERWVIVNGARMGLTELDYLTRRLHEEYEKTLAEKRSIVNRLLKWFKNS